MTNTTKKPNILVIGDLMIDHYLWGSTNRISPEAPVQVVDIKKETTVLGGAGNVVNNLVSLGADVMVLSVVGEDKIAEELTQMLIDIDVRHYLICDENRKTTKKSRIIASHQQVVRYDHETKVDISQESEAVLSVGILNIIEQFDMVLVSDYGKGVITDSLMGKINFYASTHNIKVLVDPKGDDYTKYIGSYLLTPNKKEAIEATNIDIVDDASLKVALTKLHNTACLQVPMITLSEDGIAILDENNNVVIKPTVAREVYDVTGAGDTVLASLGYSLANGKDIVDAMEFANLAAGVVVGKIGSATATLEEVEEYKSSLHKSSIESHIKNFEEIEKTVARLKKQNKKIVFTNGCFDILHKGHVQYLDKAKSFGDVLILGLNSDASVSALKGPSRPINNENDRGYILAALESVDYVVLFTDDTPLSLIQIVQPDVLVKGGDYEGKQVVGSDIAKELKLVQFVDGKSTTKTIEKIQACNS
ncbi:MAG: bifunctional heptose 7-phosphate kinase/heptose 1-phosphate adenyltransferase [Epsilonproteobacteria bacterium]|nr:MAG: bifunctional heptose 7-phosphate kinase/heptose 1-phosphate adenyltransferase [Campylobacterota bacterium]